MDEDARSAWSGVALGILLGTLLRALLSTAFYLSLATLRLNGTAFWLLVLLAPALAPLVPRSRWPGVAAAVAVAALPLARFTPWFVPVAAAGTAAGLLALAHLDRRGLVGALLGLAVNGALLLAGASHDPLLGVPGIVAGLGLALVLLVARPQDAEPTSVPAGLAWGALLLLESAFLASPYAVARHFGAPAWSLALATHLGLAAGVLLLRRAPAVVLLAVGAVALVDVVVGSPVAVASLAALQAALAAAATRLARPNGPALALALGPATFGLLYFGQVMGPFEWGASVPLLALLALGLAVLRAPPTPAHLPRRAAVALALGLLAVPAALPAPAVEPHAGDELVVVNWNVHQGFGNRGALDPEVYADALRPLRPDVLILQEADTARLSSGGLDVVEYLSRALGLHAHARGTGIVVLSRFPLADGAPAAESRGWTTLVALDVHGETVHVQGVHLARSREERAVQVQALLADANATEGPRILAGDLNSCAADVCFGGRPSDNVHQALAVVYQDAWSAQHDPADPDGHTHPAWGPRRRIDVVLVRDLEVLDAGPLRNDLTLHGSDHLPVVARLRLAAQ